MTDDADPRHYHSLLKMGMNQVYTYIYEHCVKHSMTRVIDELHKKNNCSCFLSKVSEPSLLIASIHSIIVNASLDYDTIKLLLDSVELLWQHFGEQIAEEFSAKKFLNLVHYIKALLVTNIILDDEIDVDEKVDELNKYFPADDDLPQSPAVSPFDLNRVNYKRTQFRCFCLFFLASNKDPEDFLTPGQHQRMKGKVVQPAYFLIETVRGRLPDTFIEKFCKKPPSARQEMTFPNPVIREILFEMFGALTQPTEEDILAIINQMSKYILFDPEDILSSQESLDTMYNTSPSDDHWNSPKRQRIRPGVFSDATGTSRAACPDYHGKVYTIKRTKKLIIPEGNCLLSRTTPQNIRSPRKRLSPPIVDGWWKDTNYLSKVRYRRSNGFPKVSADAKVVLNYANVKPGQRVKVPSPLFKNITIKVPDKSNKRVSSSKSLASLGTPGSRCPGEATGKKLSSRPSTIGTRRKPFKAEEKDKDLNKTPGSWKSTGLNGSFWNVNSHKRKRKMSQLHIRLSSRLSRNKTVRESGGRLDPHSKASRNSSPKGSRVDSRDRAKNSLVKNGSIRKGVSSVEHLRSQKNSCNKVDMNLKTTRTPVDYSHTPKSLSRSPLKKTLVGDTAGMFGSPSSKATSSSSKDSGNGAKKSPVEGGFIRKECSALEHFHSPRNSCMNVEMNLKTTRTPIDYSQAAKKLCSRVGAMDRKSVLDSSPTSRDSWGQVGREMNMLASLQDATGTRSRLDTTRRTTDEALQAAGISCSRNETRTTASELSQSPKTSSSNDETSRTISSESLQSVKSSCNKDETKSRTASDSLQAFESSCSGVNSERTTVPESLQPIGHSSCGVSPKRTALETLRTASGRHSKTKKRRVTLDSLHSAKISCNKFQAKKRRTTLDSLYSAKTSFYSVDAKKRTVYDPDLVASSATLPKEAIRHKFSVGDCVKTLFSYKEPDLDLTADDEAHMGISDTSSEAANLKRIGDIETRSSKSCSPLVSSCVTEIESSAFGAKSEHGRCSTTTKEKEDITVTRMANATSPFSTGETCPEDEESGVHTCSNSQRQQTQNSQDKLVDKIRTRYRNIRANCPLRRKRKSARTGARVKTLIAQSDSSDFYRNLKKSYRKSYRRICQEKSWSPGANGSVESVDLDVSTDFSDFSDNESKLSGNVLLCNSQSTEVQKMAPMGQSGPEDFDYLSSYRRSPDAGDGAELDVLKDKTTNWECALESDCGRVLDTEVSECDSGTTRNKLPFRKVHATNNVRHWPTPDLNKPRTRNHSERRKTMYLRSSKDPEQPHRYVEMGEWLIESKFRKYHASSKDLRSANGQQRLTKSLPHRRSQRMTGSELTGSSRAVPSLGRYLKAPYVKPCILK